MRTFCLAASYKVSGDVARRAAELIIEAERQLADSLLTERIGRSKGSSGRGPDLREIQTSGSLVIGWPPYGMP